MKKRLHFPSYWQRLIEKLKRLLRPKPDPEPEDPYAYSMAPLRHPPRGRSGAAAADVDER
jgi:hypothetical protein